MNKIAVFPGTFDPITKGHESIIKRALPLFDQLIVAIGVNSSKKHMFSLDERMKMINTAFKNEPKVVVETYSGLTVEFCKSKNAKFLLRGLRNGADFDYERSISQMNSKLVDEIETIFLITDSAFSAINSTIIRDIIRNGGDAKQFLPDDVEI